MSYWKLSEYFSVVSANRVLLQRIFFSLALVSLALDYGQGMMISQIGSNPVFNQDVDPVYLFFMLTGIPGTISGPFAPYFDTLLIILCLASIVWPAQRICPVLFLVSYFVYFIVSNMLTGHHYTNIGVLLMAFPFIFRSEQRFSSAFAAVRFFFCFMMFSAACWKIARGNLWHPDQVRVMLLTTYAEELTAASDGAWIGLVQWLIANKSVAHILWIILITLEFVFLLGFVSFKWDRLLLTAYLLFFAGGWLIFRIYNFENMLFLFTLAPSLNLIDSLQTRRRLKTP